MQLDTKLAFLKIASWKQLCVVMINIQYSCVVATSFVHRADIMHMVDTYYNSTNKHG